MIWGLQREKKRTSNTLRRYLKKDRKDQSYKTIENLECKIRRLSREIKAVKEKKGKVKEKVRR